MILTFKKSDLIAKLEKARKALVDEVQRFNKFYRHTRIQNRQARMFLTKWTGKKRNRKASVTL